MRSISLVSLAAAAQVLLQFVFQCIVLARVYGASAEMDALTAALALPQVLATVLVGSLHYAFIPIFTRRIETVGLDAARETARAVFWWVAAATLAAAAAASAAAPWLVEGLYPGFDNARRLRVASLLQIVVWQVAAFGMGAVLQGIYHGTRRFAYAGAVPAVGLAVTLLGTLATSRSLGIDGAAWSILAGLWCNVALLLLPLLPEPRWRGLAMPRFHDPALPDVGRMIWPLLIGAAWYKLDPIVDSRLAAGLGEGAVAHLGYAVRILGALLVLTTSGLATVVFPSFARAAADPARLRTEISRALQVLGLIVLPVTAGLAVCRREVVRDLIQGGQFSAADSVLQGDLLAIGLGIFVGGSVGEILTKGMFALGASRAVAAIGIAGFTWGVVLKLLLVSKLGAAGILGAASAAMLGNLAVESWWLRKRIGNVWTRETLRVWGLGVVATVPAACLAAVLVRLPLPRPSLLAAPSAVLVYGGMLWVLGIRVGMFKRLEGADPVLEEPTPPDDPRSRSLRDDHRSSQRPPTGGTTS